MDEREIRLRCIEVAARAPVVHAFGPAAGVVEVASHWFDWVISEPKGATKAGTLKLPTK